MTHSPTAPGIFDGHNDLILRMITGKATAEQLRKGMQSGHIDLPRARAGGFAGGFFAIFVPGAMEPGGGLHFSGPSYDVPLPEPLEQAGSEKIVLRGFAALEALEAEGVVTLCRDADSLERAIAGETMAAIAHIEGAEAIDPEFRVLEALHARGLRSLGPVWSRPTIYGEGVPFRFPSTPDIGGGLTQVGRALVKKCNDLKIMLDLSHLNEKGFDDVAALSDAPLVATHSNAWAVCNHARNLTDRQMRVIAQSDGMVGLNLASAFLRPDGQMEPDVPLEVLLRHLDHMIGILGEDRVGFGTDFDGALVPEEIGDCAGLPVLRSAMRAHGYDEELMEKLCWRNWVRVLRKTWG